MENSYRVLRFELGDFKVSVTKQELVEIGGVYDITVFCCWMQQSENHEASADGGMLVLINQLLYLIWLALVYLKDKYFLE